MPKVFIVELRQGYHATPRERGSLVKAPASCALDEIWQAGSAMNGMLVDKLKSVAGRATDQSDVGVGGLRTACICQIHTAEARGRSDDLNASG